MNLFLSRNVVTLKGPEDTQKFKVKLILSLIKQQIMNAMENSKFGSSSTH
jgi:hypothetical protein